MSSKTSTTPETGAALRRVIEQTVFVPVRGGDVTAEAVARLGQAIGMGLLRPGDRLPPEAQLARDLGISPVSLRGALTILRKSGVLETRRGRGGGTVVTDFGSPPAAAGELPAEAELADLVDYRCVVEGGAAALAARRVTDAQLDHLRALAREMKETGTFREWSEQDTLLHLLIADVTGSSRLMVEVGRLRAAVFEISQLVPVAAEVVELANREHDRLIAAIGRHDEGAARAAMVAHVESTQALWLGLGRVPGKSAGRNP
jgi:GntR family transcriptional repressor for pyruvate dehydrogenase complex